jgi:hypothetical protein
MRQKLLDRDVAAVDQMNLSRPKFYNRKSGLCWV